MSLHDIIFLLYFWSKESLQKDISYELQLDLSNVQEWFEYLREICFEYIEENSQIIGGLNKNFEPIIVEIRTQNVENLLYEDKAKVKTSIWNPNTL